MKSNCNLALKKMYYKLFCYNINFTVFRELDRNKEIIKK